ncbi:hypothetical protein V1478_005967 [Vespula squamosa]|uniref:Uncharacterized protein n=1 Tax=Vespula squamosa TaxID=30214 RepID=A0ABD2B8W6_VESSQ
MEVCGSTLTARKRDKGEKVQAGMELIWRHLCVKAASTGRYSIWKLYKLSPKGLSFSLCPLSFALSFFFSSKRPIDVHRRRGWPKDLLRERVSTTMRSLTGYGCPDFSESSNMSLTIVSTRPFFPILTYSLENSENRLDEERMLYVSTLGFLGAIE